MTTTTSLDLDAIRRRHKAFEDAWDHEYMAPDGPTRAAASAQDVPALIAEVQRLRTEAFGALDAIVADYPTMPIAVAAGVTSDFHAWTLGVLTLQGGQKGDRS